jgi:hypothetical protein
MQWRCARTHKYESSHGHTLEFLKQFGWVLRHPHEPLITAHWISSNCPEQALTWAQEWIEGLAPVEKKFYSIWNPIGGSPLVKHKTIDEAKAEAKRLATKHPGKEFYVLCTVGVAKYPAAEYTEL